MENDRKHFKREREKIQQRNHSLFSSLFYLSSFVTIVCLYMPTSYIVFYVNPSAFYFFFFRWGIVISYWAIETRWNQKLESIDSSIVHIAIAHIHLNNIVIALVVCCVLCVCCYILTWTIAITRLKCVHT